MIAMDESDEITILDSSGDVVLDTCNSESNHTNDSSDTSVSKKACESFIIIDDSVNNDSVQICSTPVATKLDYEESQKKPIFKVIFRDESISRKFRGRVKKLLEDLLSSTIKIPSENEDNPSCLTLDIWDDKLTSGAQSTDVSIISNSHGDFSNDTLFTVDTQPRSRSDLDIPAYGKKYENAFEKSGTEEKCSPKLSCFNCMGNHSLRECQEPRNKDNIKKNRSSLNKTGIPKNARYHLDDDQKFGHMIPGQISNNLRNALGLEDDELPRHIYRMRTLGYPPGWLEEARLQHSGLSLFNSDGVRDLDTNQEPGEIVEAGDKDQYDVKKIYDFPGFNVPPPPGTYDDHESDWTPQMQARHSKHTMLLMLKGRKAEAGYKRKKLKMSSAVSENNSNTIPSNMEIEDVDAETVVECLPINGVFQPPLPLQSPPKPPEPFLPSSPPPPPGTENVKLSQQEVPQQSADQQESQSPTSQIHDTSPLESVNSPSLLDLENMKKRLLVELQSSNSQSNSDSLTEGDCSNVTSKSDATRTEEVIRADQSNVSLNKSSRNCGSVKSVDLGTPVLQSSSPYRKLPSSDKFSKDICDVINFENLPDAIGKYKQMTSVLEKVRNTMAKLNQDS